MGHWIDDLQRVGARGENAVLVSVVSAKGSVPRGPGTRMVVAADTVDGTIGGGHLELSAIGIARDMLAAAGNPDRAGELRRFPLGASLGQCCGGLVNLLFEPVGAADGWIESLAALRRAGTASVVVTSTDRATTGRLIVTAGAIHGTFDVPALEASLAAAARALLSNGGGAQLLRIPTGPERGDVQVFLDPVREPGFPIVLFGAGHVGRALVEILARIPCTVTWVDGRETEFPAAVGANVTIVLTDTPESEVAAAPPGAYFLVMTHSHPLDQALAECILRRGGFAYFGLIGSASKRSQFERRMAQRGIPVASFADMTCPIGVPGIHGKEPATIAIAVAAQLIETRERRAAARPVDAAAANGAAHR